MKTVTTSNEKTNAVKKAVLLFAALVFTFSLCVMSGSAAEVYKVKVQSGYLALRNAKAFDSSNEIGRLYTGESVEVQDKSEGQYWWVYAPTLRKSGYVNSDYLVSTSSSSSGIGSATVRVESGYLALRNAKAFDSRNEIGRLYTGESVQIQNTNDNTYWWVYAPSLGKSGYVNSNYLINVSWNSSSYGNTMTVSVQSGYLALRNAKAYDNRNEIGRLYTGDTVEVEDTSDSTYWWVYAPSLGKSGYVNKDYLVGGGRNVVIRKTVRVSSGYLALRNAKAYDSSNEIARLYTGDTVEVQDSTDTYYWYVYVPSLGKYGYVNKDYLY